MSPHEIREYSPGRFLLPGERHLLERLLSERFPGQSELLSQIPHLLVTADCATCATLELSVSTSIGRAVVRGRVPVEAQGPDEDGKTVHVLVHVVDGSLRSLEVYREDGNEVRRMPVPESLAVTAI